MFKKLFKSDEPFWRYLFAKVFFVIRFHGNRQMFDQRKYVFLLYVIVFFEKSCFLLSFQKSLTGVKHHLKSNFFVFIKNETFHKHFFAVRTSSMKSNSFRPFIICSYMATLFPSTSSIMMLFKTLSCVDS